MKKLSLLFSILLISVSVTFAQSLATDTFSEPNMNLPGVGDNFNVPINIAGFPPAVRYIEVVLEYDPTVLTYTAIVNLQDPVTAVNVQFPEPGKIKVNYNQGGFAYFAVSDGKLFDIQFDYSGGDSPLTFSPESRYRTASIIYLTNFTNGAVIGDPLIENTIVDGAWETAGDWSLGVVPNAYHNVFVQGMATISSAAVANDLTIEVDGELTVNMGASLDVAGDILIDGDETGTASFVNKGTFTMAGEATVKQFMVGALAWHLVSVPVDEVMSADVFMNCYLQYWDEPNSEWVDVQLDPDPAFSVPMNTPMMGYATAFHGAADKMLEFTGVLNDGPYSIAVTNAGTSGDPDLDGWNLVGNPYPSALDVDGAGWTRINVGSGVAYWDETIDNYRYYAFGVPANNGSQFIPPMQGFFVKATGAGVIGVTNEARAHTMQGFYKSDPANTLRLTVQKDNFTDEAVIRFHEQAGINYDEQFDFFKLFADNVPQLYSITPDDESLAINALPEISEDVSIPLGFRPGVNGMMSLTVSGLETFESGTPVWLYDEVTDTHWNLRDNPVYNFVANTNDTENRFFIQFKNLTSVPGLDHAVANIFAYNKQVYVDAGNAKGEIVVMNILGQELVREQLTEQLNVISLPVSNSYVVVKVISDQGISSKKVFVN